MKKKYNFLKWRALVAGLLLAIIVGFLYGKKTPSETVLIVLSIASIVHIVLFFYFHLKDLNKEK